MDQITGALVGIALVLSAVFVPMAFFSGSAGVIYRQLSITIVSSMILSVLVALIFTPALCLDAPQASITAASRSEAFSAGSTPVRARQARYGRQVSHIARRPGRALLALAVIVAVIAALHTTPAWRVPAR